MSQKIGRKCYPLRRVVGHAPHPEYPSVLQEVLECGHQQNPRTDIYGETNAARRRCRKCAQEADVCSTGKEGKL